MKKRVEVSYNPQVGYLKTIFSHSFDFLTSIRGYKDSREYVDIEANTYQKRKAKVRITILSEQTFRLQMYPYGDVACFNNQIFPFVQRASYQVEETEEAVLIKTERLCISLKKLPWEMEVFLDGRILTKEQIYDSNVDNMCKYLPIGWDLDEQGEVCRVRESMYLFSDEAFYGFGEKFTEFNKRGQKINCWQQDALSTNTNVSYKNHPYFMSSRGYSILVNSFTRMNFDMGFNSNVSYGVEVDDRYLDYVLFAERNPKRLLSNYINMTGKIPLIPKWAFGLWMSKCVYRTQQEVMDVVRTANEKGIIIDVINLDAWQNMIDGGAWEWDTDRFPDPQGMIDALRDQNIHLCLWIFPYICEKSKYFKIAEENEWLVKDENGKALRFYPTASSDAAVGCFDFTNPNFIEWYVPRVKKVISMGIGAVKTDFSEMVPENAVYYDGSNGVQGHNKLTFLYAETIYNAMREVKDETGERPMLWGRSGYAGSHMIPAAWAGDSSTHLNNHACALNGGLSLGISGVAFWGFDMGGFYNTDYEGYECFPKEEEYIRSIQLGFFSGLSRCHGKTPREPWNYEKETFNIFKFYNDLRHRLQPYLYSTAIQSSADSIPMMRALILEFPQDRNVRSLGQEYMLGDSLLIAPVFDQDDYAVYLPKGEWADFYTGHIYHGGDWMPLKPTLDRIPVFVRADSMVPMLKEPSKSNIKGKYADLKVVLNVKSDTITLQYRDDDLDVFLHLEKDDKKIQITTKMPASEFLLYGDIKKTAELTINGKVPSFQKITDTSFQAIVSLIPSS